MAADSNISTYASLTSSVTSLGSDELFTLQWQGDPESTHWYGFHVDFRADYPSQAIERIKALGTFMRRLLEGDVLVERPERVIPALGLERLVYDDRLSLYIPLEQVPPEGEVRWMAWQDDHCVVAIVAPDEATASEKLLQAFAKEVAGARYGNYSQKMERWIQEGKPIRRDGHRDHPDVRSLEEILKPLKEPAPAEQPAAIAA